MYFHMKLIYKNELFYCNLKRFCFLRKRAKQTNKQTKKQKFSFPLLKVEIFGASVVCQIVHFLLAKYLERDFAATINREALKI